MTTKARLANTYRAARRNASRKAHRRINNQWDRGPYTFIPPWNYTGKPRGCGTRECARRAAHNA